VALSRNVSPKHAMEMLLTGVAIGAEDAFRLGLVIASPRRGARGRSGVGAQDLKEISAGDRGRQEGLLRPMRQASLGGLRAGERRHVANMLMPDAQEGMPLFWKARAGLAGRM